MSNIFLSIKEFTCIEKKWKKCIKILRCKMCVCASGEADQINPEWLTLKLNYWYLMWELVWIHLLLQNILVIETWWLICWAVPLVPVFILRPLGYEPLKISVWTCEIVSVGEIIQWFWTSRTFVHWCVHYETYLFVVKDRRFFQWIFLPRIYTSTHEHKVFLAKKVPFQNIKL